MKRLIEPTVTRTKYAQVHNPNPRNDPDVQKGIDEYNQKREQEQRERERQEKEKEEKAQKEVLERIKSTAHVATRG